MTTESQSIVTAEANLETGEVEKIFFHDGRFKVTSTKFITPRSTLQLRYIEQIQISRSHLGFAFLLPILSAMTLYKFSWYFYWYELILLMGVSIAITFGAWRLGGMRLISRTLNQKPYFWDYHTLKQIRVAIQSAIEELETQNGEHTLIQQRNNYRRLTAPQ